MTVKEFIQNVLIGEIKKIQQEEGHHYISFGLISQGIEFLGACLDNEPFNTNTRGISSQRFNKAITELFDSKYHTFVKTRSTEQFDLYGNLRCGLLHVFVPGADLEVIQESEIKDYGEHLDVKNLRNNDRLILVSQNLMADFENACNNIIARIDNNQITNNKVYNQLLSTSPED